MSTTLTHPCIITDAQAAIDILHRLCTLPRHEALDTPLGFQAASLWSILEDFQRQHTIHIIKVESHVANYPNHMADLAAETARINITCNKPICNNTTLLYYPPETQDENTSHHQFPRPLCTLAHLPIQENLTMKEYVQALVPTAIHYPNPLKLQDLSTTDQTTLAQMRTNSFRTWHNLLKWKQRCFPHISLPLSWAACPCTLGPACLKHYVHCPRLREHINNLKQQVQNLITTVLPSTITAPTITPNIITTLLLGYFPANLHNPLQNTTNPTLIKQTIMKTSINATKTMNTTYFTYLYNQQLQWKETNNPRAKQIQWLTNRHHNTPPPLDNYDPQQTQQPTGEIELDSTTSSTPSL